VGVQVYQIPMLGHQCKYDIVLGVSLRIDFSQKYNKLTNG